MEASQSPRLTLHASFTPSTYPAVESAQEFVRFQEIILKAKARELDEQDKNRKERERNLREKLETCVDEQLAITPEFGEKISKLKRATAAKKPLLAKLEASPDWKAHESRLKAQSKAVHAVNLLFHEATSGDREAVKALAEIAELAVTLLVVCEKMRPHLVAEIAESKTVWPALISSDSDWVLPNKRRMETLHLGQRSEFRVRFRQVRGAAVNRPARVWAMAAVRTLEETKLRVALYGHYATWINEEVLNGNLYFVNPPEWVWQACRLPGFDRTTVSEWAVVIRDMIRQQRPEFHEAPEWANQRNSLLERGAGTRGVIQNAILDDIVSALKRIAPKHELLKTSS